MAGVPYAGMLGGRDALGVIAETPGRLAQVLEGVSAAHVAQVPPLNRLVREILIQGSNTLWMLTAALAIVGCAEDHAVLQPFNQDAWAQVYEGYSLAEAWACYNGLRAWNVAFVRRLSAAEKERMYTHPERGEERLWTVVEIMAGHDLHHLTALEK